MMKLDIFIISVYCLVEEHYQTLFHTHPLRHGGFAPQMTDSEVLTIEIVGEYLGLESDTAIFEYFTQHYQPFFPALRERTLLVRQAANLWLAKERRWKRLTQVSGEAADPIQLIDTAPLPVCHPRRAGRRDRCFAGIADWGYCAAKDEYYYGFKEGIRTSSRGMIVHCPLLEARPHDIQHLEVLLDGFQGIALGDKAFLDAHRQEVLRETFGIDLQVPLRSNMPDPRPKAFRRWLGRLRRRVETVISQLCGRFHLQRIRVRNLWHLQSRLLRKVLAHTVGVFFNLQLGRSPLDLDGLVAVGAAAR